LKVKGELGLGTSDSYFIGESRINLLKSIKETGSITQAAKHAGLSYKGAWEAVQSMNNSSEEILVIKKTGGSGGGGAELSPYALKVIEAFDLVNLKLKTILAEVEEHIGDIDDLLNILRRISMKISVRNQYLGKIKKITFGQVNAEVIIALKSGCEIAANITVGSVEKLGLKEGNEAFALVKASNVIIADPSLKGKLSTRNFLTGIVESFEKGGVNSTVTIKLDDGNLLTGIITNESIDSLGLKEGMPLAGAFKSSAVIIGVND
jgi:molybdate transport system regulatory protein